jgi:CMP-N-acetylneuraminic acid synthetase
MKIVGLVPIRLNSKRTPGKSVRRLGNRPLLCWLLEELDQLEFPIHVYTSQPKTLAEHLDFTPRHVVFTPRPESLDGDWTKGVEIYQQFARDVPADAYVLSHCTSPFLRADTVRRVVEPVLSGEASCCLTVERVQTFSWFDGRPLNFEIPRTQTQRLKPVLVETSGAYCYTRDIVFRGDRSDLNPRLVEITWPETEDIDHEEDFLRCEAELPLILQRRAQAAGGTK